jgi:replicative DNA helicase
MSRPQRKPVNPGLFQADEAEKAVLGGMLCSDVFALDIAGRLTAEDFGSSIHQRLYLAMQGLASAGKPLSRPILLNLVEHDPNDQDPATYLAALQVEADLQVASDCVDTVREASARRRLLTMARRIEQAAAEIPPGTSWDQIVGAASDLVEKVQPDDDGFATFGEAAVRAVDQASLAYRRDGTLAGIATGLTDLDERLGGLSRSDLIVIAGRPGMAKTSLASTIAVNVARAGLKVGFYSLEMKDDQLAMRELSAAARVPGYRVRRGRVDEDELSAFVTQAHAMASLPLFIADTGGITIGTLARKARALKRRRGLDLIVVDYIQLMRGAGRRGRDDTRNHEIGEITTGLKTLAKELDVPVLALSQLSREVEKRDVPKPQLSDLRDSGSIEQDADVVLFLYREEYYLKNKEPRPGSEAFEKWQTEMEACHGRAEVIIGKQRHGPTGTVTLHFDAELTTFGDWDEPARLSAPRAKPKPVFAFKYDTHRAIFAAAMDARADGGVRPGLDLIRIVPSGQPIFRLKDWRKLLRARSPSRGEDDTPDKKADRVVKATNDFIDRYSVATEDREAIIGFHEDWVWLTGKPVRGFDTDPPTVLRSTPERSPENPEPEPEKPGAPYGETRSVGPENPEGGTANPEIQPDELPF